MQKILLYYKFTPLKDPEAVMQWQKTLCESLGLRGRILISAQGLNGTVGGDVADLKAYIKQTKAYQNFKDTVFKWSEGGREDFPRLSVKARTEIVAFDAVDELEINAQGLVNGGIHLTPDGLHELIEAKGDEVIFFDGRNKHEAAIGQFEKAVVPDVETSRDFIRELESGKYDDLKDKPVVTYCTGGIRCEVLSVLMKNRGFKEVYQLNGGIVTYGERYGDAGYWNGKCFVFDRRMHVAFSDDAKDIGSCSECGCLTSEYENCAVKECNRLVLVCPQCAGSRYVCGLHAAVKV